MTEHTLPKKITVPVRIVLRGRELVAGINPRDKAVTETLLRWLEGKPASIYNGDVGNPYVLTGIYKSRTLRGWLRTGARELLSSYRYFMGIEVP